MNILGNINLLSVGVVIACIIILGAVIFFSNSRSITNKTFLGLSFGVTFWSIFNYLSYQFQDPTIILWILRLNMFFAIWYAYFIFQLSYVFPEEKVIFTNKYRFILMPATILISLLTLTSLIFQNIEIIDPLNAEVKLITGPGIVVFGGLIGFLLIFGVGIFIKKTIKAPKEIRIKYYYILIGLFATFGLHVVFNFIFPAFLHITRFIQIGAMFAFPFIFATFYAILKHNLLNIRVVAAEIFILLFSIASLFEVLIAKGVADRIFRSFVFILVVVIGFLLIKSVRKEVQQREQLEKLDKDLEEKNKKLEELNAFKSQFLSFASHQIKTPVAVIKGFSGLIYDGSYGAVPDKIKEVVGRIKEVSDQMVVLLNNFLDLRRIDEGKMEYAFSKANLVEMTKEIVTDLQIMAKNKKLELTGEYESDEINSNVDKDKFRQVVQNLIENAIKYTDVGSVKASIKKENNSVLICVADTGRGIAKELLPKLFEQFNRDPKAAKEIAGTGLGLYIAKQITLAHKGEIWAESDGEGKGSRFYVRLGLEK